MTVRFVFSILGADLENTTYLPVPTSYDYNAPLDESGRYFSEKYDMLRTVIMKVGCVWWEECWQALLRSCPAEFLIIK